MSRVWLTGDAVVDLIPDGQQHYLKCPGGAPANVAVAIARLSGRSAFFGRIGNDPFGRFMQQTFTDEQVDCQHLYFDPYIALPLWLLTLMSMESAVLPLW